MFKSLFLPIIAVIIFIVLVGLFAKGKFGNFIKPSNTHISNAKTLKINNIEINIEVAKTDKERAKGLGERNSLDENSGMLFIFDADTEPIFWMKNTKIPLDIIWINDNKIVGIDKYVKPEIGVIDNNLTRYKAPSKVDYVLEVNSGFCDKNDIKVGQSLSGLEQL